MSEKKLMTYEGLEEYNIKWHERLQAMTISDADIDAIAFKALGVDALEIPDEWTVSSDGTLNLAASNAYSYWPEGAGTKNIVISNPSARNSFWLKLTDGGNFPLAWDSNIQWESEQESDLEPFNEDIFYFYKNNDLWIGNLISSNHITEYFKFTIDAKTKTDYYYNNYSDYGHGAIIPMKNFEYGATIDWGDGTIENVSTIDLSENGDADESVPFPRHVYDNDGLYQIKITYDHFYDVTIYDWLSGDDADPSWDFDWYIQNVISIDSPLPNLKGSWNDCSTSFYFSTDIGNPFDQSYYTSLESVPTYLYRNEY